MTYLFKLAERTARLRALPLLLLAAALAGCDTDRLTNSSDPAAAPAGDPATQSSPSFATAFRGGIAFGTWALPTNMFGDMYNGAMRNISPGELLGELAGIKARGGKVILAMAGKEDNFKDGAGHFSFNLWKERVDRFRGVNFNSYIDDGTVIGHYMIDEPNDPVNWNNQPVPGTMVEQMATYSKQIWPKLATVVRVEPAYLSQWGGYHNLDAAWAQWVTRKGDPGDYIRGQVAIAQKLGIMLVTGLNIRKGAPNQQPLSASVVQSAGSALLANDYPCAFISWEYDPDYLARADIKSVMAQLSQKAETHPARSCLGGGASVGGGSGGGDGTGSGGGPITLPSIKGMVLTAVKAANSRYLVYLKWTGATGTMVDVYRNGERRAPTRNDGLARSYPQRAGQYTFKVCDAGTTRCSNGSTVTIK
jgi:hypothetical protein